MDKRLIQLKAWVLNCMNKLNISDIHTDSIKEGETYISIDQSTNKYLSRIDIWDNGMLDLEIISIDSGEIKLYEHYEVNKQTDLDKVLERYIDILG